MKPASGNTKTSLVFRVTRQAPELIAPAGPTPYEFKELSDFDDQDSLRFQIAVIHFYRNEGKHSGGSALLRGKDPARAIKEAIAKALVSYYPLAGRLREMQGRKLVVECNGQGILFVEADADVRFKEFGDASLQPPFPRELLYDVPGSTPILNTPLLLIQVTRLKCGGFILAIRLNHTMIDAQGLVQFLNAVGELACGADTPSIRPVWERHILFRARNPPKVTCEHHAYDEVVDVDNTMATITPLDDMVHKSFFFGPKEIAALRRFIPPNVKASTFEILTACLWRCRTISLQQDPEETFRIVCVVSARYEFNGYVPEGYYGNSFALSGARSTARELCSNPIAYALELVKKTRRDVTPEHVKSLADLMVLKGRPHFSASGTFVVSDITRLGFDRLDLGWGPPVYGGIFKGGYGAITGASSFYNSYKNEKGEQGIVVPICLPDENAMAIFIKELNGLLSDTPTHPIATFISSSL